MIIIMAIRVEVMIGTDDLLSIIPISEYETM